MPLAGGEDCLERAIVDRRVAVIVRHQVVEQEARYKAPWAASSPNPRGGCAAAWRRSWHCRGSAVTHQGLPCTRLRAAFDASGCRGTHFGSSRRAGSCWQNRALVSRLGGRWSGPCSCARRGWARRQARGISSRTSPRRPKTLADGSDRRQFQWLLRLARVLRMRRRTTPCRSSRGRTRYATASCG